MKFGQAYSIDNGLCRLFFMRLCLILAFALIAGGLSLATLPGTAMAGTHHKAATHKAHHHKARKKRHRANSHILGNSPKYSSFIIDAATGRVLQATDPDKRVHPASLTKMMTLMLVFQALKDGRATLHDQVRISSHAHSMEPSKLNIPVGQSIRLDDAILAIVTHSANDVAVALAEHVGGTEGTFASMMNHAAKRLGMTRTYYVNASGLPNPRQVTTARDTARLARALIYNYPRYYRYFSTPSFRYDGHLYGNHNHLMRTYKGMDGIKTGYINASGFNLAASAKRGGQRLIGIVFGGRSARWRDRRMASLLDAGFAKDKKVAIASSDTMQASINPAAGAPSVQRVASAAPLPAAGADSGNPVSNMARAWAVQVGAYSNRTASGNALRAVMNTLPRSLSHATPAIAPLLTADGMVYRARLSGYTRAEALSVCSRLTNCLTVSPYANN